MERYRLPIPPDAVPIAHQPPYRRIDPAIPQGYPKVISLWEVIRDGGREPDPRKYSYDASWSGEWVLREEFR